MRMIRNGRWTSVGLAVALTLAACGGPDTKEAAATGTSASIGNQQEETAKEQEKETDETVSLETQKETSPEKQVPSEELYTITRDDIDHLVTGFLEMQANAVFKDDSPEYLPWNPLVKEIRQKPSVFSIKD